MGRQASALDPNFHAHTNARISLHHALLCGCGQAVLLVVLLCKIRRAGWLLIQTVNSVLFCTLLQATDKQCSRRCNFSKLTVSSGAQVSSRIAPEFRYIMFLAAETDRWTDKLVFSFGKSRHTMKPEFRYIMPCFADVDKPSCSLLSYANQAVLVGC